MRRRLHVFVDAAVTVALVAPKETVLSPAVLLGKESWVYPNFTVPKGYYPPQTRLVPADRKIKLRK